MLAKALTVAALAVAPVVADYGVNVYWGQTAGESLETACQSDGFDYVTIAFIVDSPEQDPTGYPGTNFGAHCSAEVYYKDNVASPLGKDCTEIIRGIPACQANGKKVLLSIGGAAVPGVNYEVTSPEKGREFADFLWGAFGPYDVSWTGPRPFDSSATEHVSVDGFDFDIETKFDDQSGYVALITRLRTLFATASGEYLISGAPQCPLDPSIMDMETMINDAVFDLLFIQFYNNEVCDAIPNNTPNDSFNFDAWASYIQGTASYDAKLFIGLPGAPSNGYLEPDVAFDLMNQYKTHSSFGGAMIWDVVTGSNKTANGRTYYEHIHDALFDKVVPTVTATATASATPTATACIETYTVVPGNYCYQVAVDNDLTLDQLRALNPTLDAACDLYVGQVLCVKVGAAPTSSAVTTASASADVTASASADVTVSASADVTASASADVTASASADVTASASADVTASASADITASASADVTASASADITASASADVTASASADVTASASADVTASASADVTASASADVTASASADVTASASADVTASASADVTASASADVTASASADVTASASADVTASASADVTASASADVTASASADVTASASADVTASASADVTASASADVTASASADITASASADVTASSSDAATATGSSDSNTSGEVSPTAPYGNSTISAPVTSGTGSPSAPATTEPASLTTSTVYSTTIYTITSCAASVTNCPALGQVTTEIIPIYTTVCPVSAHPTTTPDVPLVEVTATVVPDVTTAAAELTTSTIYSTTVYTVTSCAPTVTNCPAEPHVTTEIIAIGTTVCPVSEQPAGPTGASEYPASPSSDVPAGEQSGPTTTTRITSTAFTTVTVAKPSSSVTLTVTAVPSVSVPVSSVSVPVSSVIVPVPSVSVPVPNDVGNPYVPSGTGSPVATPSGNGTVVATPTATVPVTAGAARNAAAVALPALMVALLAL